MTKSARGYNIHLRCSAPDAVTAFLQAAIQ
jgi:hypothetical protein